MCAPWDLIWTKACYANIEIHTSCLVVWYGTMLFRSGAYTNIARAYEEGGEGEGKQGKERGREREGERGEREREGHEGEREGFQAPSPLGA